MFLTKIIIVLLLIFIFLYLFYNKKEEIENFNIFGKAENLCPNFNLIQINTKDSNLKLGTKLEPNKKIELFEYYIVGDTREKKYIIEEFIQPYNNNKLEYLCKSKNYLWVHDNKNNIKYAHFRKYDTNDLLFENLFEINNLSKQNIFFKNNKKKLIKILTNSYNDMCVIIYEESQTFKIMVVELNYIEDKNIELLNFYPEKYNSTKIDFPYIITEIKDLKIFDNETKLKSKEIYLQINTDKFLFLNLNDDQISVKEIDKIDKTEIYGELTSSLSSFKSNLVETNLHDTIKNNILLSKIHFTNNEKVKKSLNSKLPKLYKKYITTNSNPSDIKNKEFCILVLDEQEYEKLTMLEKRYINKSNILAGFYYKITNRENQYRGKPEDIFTRINDNYNYFELESILIPSFKFEFTSSIDYFDNEKVDSLYNYFKKNENKLGTTKDWIYLYNAFKNAGFYYPNKFSVPSERIRNIIKYDNLIKVHNSYKNKHKAIIEKSDFNEIYNFQDAINLNRYANIYLYETPSDQKDENEKTVLIHFNFNSDKNQLIEDVKDKDKKMVGLKKTKQNQKDLDSHNRVFYNYELVHLDNFNNYSNLNQEEQKFFIWTRKEIKNFKEFMEEIIGLVDINEIDLEKERLMGLFEISEKFIDGYYLDTLYKLKDKLNEDRNINYDIKQLDIIIKEKQEIVQSICTYNSKTDKLENIIGYPFNIIYKKIDIQGGKLCYPQIDTVNEQKLFLMNNISFEGYGEDLTTFYNKLVPPMDKLQPSLYDKVYKLKEYDEGSATDFKIEQDYSIVDNTNKKIKYPFIKQEFISYTGFGNSIQFYKENRDEFTMIGAKNICKNIKIEADNCGEKADDCTGYELGYVNLDNSPKCEIQNSSVSSEKESENEQLYIGVVPTNACSMYMLLGNKKFYFKLGRIFTNKGGQKDQLDYIYLIQWLDNNNDKYNNKFLTIDGKNIVLTSKPPNTKSIEDKYKFYLKLKNSKNEDTIDNYGKYIYMSDRTGNLLTLKYNIFNPLEIKFTLEEENNNLNRNSIQNNYIQNKEFSSQKFLLHNSLARYIQVNDNLNDNTFNKMVNEHKKVNNLNRKISIDDPENIIVDLLDPKEEIELSEKVNSYLKNMDTEIGSFNEKIKNNFGLTPQNLDELERVFNRTKQEVRKRSIKLEKYIQDTKKYLVFNKLLENQNSGKQLIDIELLNKDKLDVNNLLNEEDDNIKKRLLDKNNIFLKSIEKMDKLLKKDNYKPKCNPKIETFDNLQYSDKEYNNHLVDKYRTYITKKIDKLNTNLCNKNKEVDLYLKKIQELSKSVNYFDNSNNKELRLTEEIEKNQHLNRDIFNIKNHEHSDRINKIEEKIQELNRMKCKLKMNNKKNVNDRYNSIISKEDADLLNVYKLTKCEIKNNFNDKIPVNPKYDYNLNYNKILINGGCLNYNQKENVLNTKHCIISNPDQVFEVEKINSVDDLKKNNLGNHQAFDKPFHLIKKKLDKNEKVVGEKIFLEDDKSYCPLENNNLAPGPTDSSSNKKPCDEVVNEYLCLHKENNELSFRECKNIRNQQWIYSTSSNSCN